MITKIVSAVALAVAAAVAIVLLVVPVLRPQQPVKLHNWRETPVGFTFAQLQHRTITPQLVASIEADEATARYAYHANTIRLQIQQQRLVGYNGHSLDAEYLADVEAVTDYGRRIGLTIVLNAQTEPGVGFRYGPHADGASAVTLRFWRVLAGHYANARHVVFDLFNEPRKQEWPAWQASHQQIIDMIRHRLHAHNWIWVDGLHWGSRLDGVPLLHGSRIVYTYHHPGAPYAGGVAQTPATWAWAFGSLARSGQPVIDAEFENHPAHNAWDRRNRMNAPTLHAYLHYLRSNHIGLLVFGLPAHRLLHEYRHA